MTPARTIAWIGDTTGFVRLLDQTLLPTQVEYRDCRTVEEVWEAIKVLRVRGAPAIGVAAAMGVVVGMQTLHQPTPAAFRQRLQEVTDLSPHQPAHGGQSVLGARPHAAARGRT